MLDRKGLVVWFTGLSGSGKSTLARATALQLGRLGLAVEVIDGDDLRHGLCADLGFSRADREQNVRRACYLAQRLVRHCNYVLVAMIAPYRTLRAEVAATVQGYREVFVNAPLAVCEERDPKGLYRKARTGDIKHFTGLDDPFDPPLRPALECRTDRESVDFSAAKVVCWLTGGAGGAAGATHLLRALLEAEPAITAGDFARRLGVSPRALTAQLRRSGARNFRAVREEEILGRAKLLLGDDCPVKQAAFQLGFKSVGGFERFFHRTQGCPPGKFRSQARGNGDLSKR